MNKKLLIFLIIPFLLTGCYDYKELNTISITTAVEISKSDNMYHVSAQVINPQSPDKTIVTQAPFIMYEASGKTIQEAYRNIALNTSRYIYSNHMELLIINESIAKEDISQIIDFYLRNPSIRTEFYVLIGKDENILSIITPIEDVSSTSIKNTLDTNSKFQGMANIITFNELTDMVINPNLEVILPSIKLTNNDESIDNKDNNKEDNNNQDNKKEIENNQNNNDESISLENTEKTKIDTKYELNGLAIFKDNKLIDYLTKQQSISYNIIKNNIYDFVITHKCKDNQYITIEVIDSKSKINVKNNQINISINMKSNINESTCEISLNKSNNIKKLQKDIEKDLTKKLTNDINYIKNTYNTDIFGFLEMIYKHDYDNYKKVSNNWYQGTYKNIPVNINTNIDIIGKGNILEAINEKD